MDEFLFCGVGHTVLLITGIWLAHPRPEPAWTTLQKSWKNEKHGKTYRSVSTNSGKRPSSSIWSVGSSNASASPTEGGFSSSGTPS